jgi:hypothetical protein
LNRGNVQLLLGESEGRVRVAVGGLPRGVVAVSVPTRNPLGRGTVLQRYTQTDEGSHLLGRDDMRVEAVREYVGVVARP